LDREKLSVTIITFNEEKNIRDCLSSVKWADEIIVVDSGSSDKTIEICKDFTDKVFFNKWIGMKEQKQYAVDKAFNSWIFSIDADERLTDKIRDFVLEELKNPSYDGYRFPRQNFFLGKWMKHGGWYPDMVLRFFDKRKGHFGGINPHDKVIIGSGRIKTVPLPIIHKTYNSMSQYLLKQNMYSTVSAIERVKAGKKVLPILIPVKTAWKFVETYFIKRGIMDGFHGFIAAMGATYSTFLKHVKIWELSGAKKKVL
jgi:glycosyltransferase involved in cell wall biosynthesis